MLPRLRAVFLLAALGCAGNVSAQTPNDSWLQAVAAMPAGWAAMLVLFLAALALALHVAFVTGERRAVPPRLGETLRRSMEAGNYQEAWEACGRWDSAFLARVLRPGLERIGNGWERVESALDRRTDHARRALSVLLWSLLAIGVAAPVLGATLARMGLPAAIAASASGPNARGLTLAEGNFLLLAAAAFATAALSLIFWLRLRNRAARALATARAEAGEMLRTLPYDELEGLRIGRDFDAGHIETGEGDSTPSGKLRVSRELTTACPHCNAPINPSRPACPHCGAAFDWS